MEDAEYISKPVNYKVRYLGKTDFDAIHGKVYQCIKEWYLDGKLTDVSFIDETGEDYVYSIKIIEKV